MANRKRGREAFIDLLKVIAIGLVILFHFWYDAVPDNHLRLIGYIGVSLFFITSGFLLAKNYSEQDKFSIKWFFKRYVKIAVIYYLALVLILILFSNQAYGGNLFGNLFSHFAFIDSWFPQYEYGIISPAWFLTPLIVLYFFFPFLNKLIKKDWRILIPIFLIMTIVRHMKGTYTSYNFLFFIGEFCFGIAFAYGKRMSIFIISFLSAFVNPVFVIPFAIFMIFSVFDEKYISSKITSFIAGQTIVLFLFHEGLMNLVYNKWHIYYLSKWQGIIVFILAVVLVSYAAKLIQDKIIKRL